MGWYIPRKFVRWKIVGTNIPQHPEWDMVLHLTQETVYVNMVALPNANVTKVVFA